MAVNFNCAPNDVIRDADDWNGLSVKSDTLQNSIEKDKPHDIQETSEDQVTPDDILFQLGGCGTFQVILVIIVHAMKIVVCWSMIDIAFFAFTPRWKCLDTMSVNTTDASSLAKSDNFSLVGKNANKDIWNEQCETATATPCSLFEFETGTKTLITEFNLICDRSWIPATISSLQMGGTCLGTVLSGRLSDIFGRKVPLFASMALLAVFHSISYFAKTWILLGAARVFIGIGCAFYMTTCYTICVEYSLSRWRSVVTGFPSWSIQACMFALLAWLLPDWKQITLVTIVISLITLSAWFYVPESFRWLFTKNKLKKTKFVINRISRINKHAAPDCQRICDVILEQESSKRTEKSSMLVLFRKLDILKITIPLSIIWCTTGVVQFGINFGIQKLSGNLYLNISLFNLVSTPARLISIYLQNRFGRRNAIWAALSVCLSGGLVVGIIQHIDTPDKENVTNYCAIVASAGIDAVFAAIQTLSLELYPTVIRNTGYGFVTVFARVGAVVGPQFVYLSEKVPGILFFMVAFMSIVSILATCVLPETRNKTMVDKLETKHASKTERY